MPKLWVRFGDKRDYPIIIKSGVIKSVGPLISSRVHGKKTFILSHPRIFKLYGKQVILSLAKAGVQSEVILLPEGETTKTLANAEKIIGKMITKKADRSTFITALGGGVIGDLAGFVASVYMRGIELVQIPTTLLAQVDSSVGGKVAVNHKLGKNMIGAFLQPRIVVTDPDVLKTLSKRQFKSGLAEIIKAAIIADASFFRLLEKQLKQLLFLDTKTLSLAISKSCAIKAAIVEKDEKEQGLRAILNYGHTFGHALETYHYYKHYLHGEAVSIGMVAAAKLAWQEGLSTEEDYIRQKQLLCQVGLPVTGNGEDLKKIVSLMKADKKVSKGEINFILTPHIGHARICKKIVSFSVHQVLGAVLTGA